MNKPILPNGIHYLYGVNGEKICLGSMTGRANHYPAWEESDSLKLRMVKLRINSGGYDEGGAYFGQGNPIYWTFDDNDTSIFFRAKNRLDAKRIIRQTLPNAKFYN